MLSKNDELFLKLGESVEPDSKYLIRSLELLNNSHENSLKAFRQGLRVAEKRNDNYEIKVWNKRIGLYEGMINKNKQLIDKLR